METPAVAAAVWVEKYPTFSYRFDPIHPIFVSSFALDDYCLSQVLNSLSLDSRVNLLQFYLVSISLFSNSVLLWDSHGVVLIFFLWQLPIQAYVFIKHTEFMHLYVTFHETRLSTVKIKKTKSSVIVM